jgi:SpoVK/Ycf46/Vps4 family AAA+-type ATPase
MRSQREIKHAVEALNLSAKDKTHPRSLWTWTFGKGLVEDKKGATAKESTESPPEVIGAMVDLPRMSVVILRLFHHFLDDPLVQSHLLDLIPKFKIKQCMLIILSPVVKLPPELEKEFALIETALPSKGQILEVLEGIVKGSNFEGDKIPTKDTANELAEAALGLTTSEAENALTLAIVRPSIAKAAKVWDPKIVLDEKCQALKKTGLLEYIPVAPDGLKQVGGLEELKGWVRKRKAAFTEKAREFGLPAPKGILLVGPPGCGKSLSAKAISGELNLPLLRLDMGKMFGSLVGQSEGNMRQAIQVAEAISPCILWIDEIEKGLAGSQSSGSTDSGVGARVLGTILTWMQDKKSPVFVYATANDVNGLPPELLRRGRFDEMFSVDLPTEEERLAIFEIHFKKKGRGKLLEKKIIDPKFLAGDPSVGFTGAEIEAAIIEGMYSAFDDGREITNKDVEDALKVSKPMSKMMAEKILAIRRWCKDRTRQANLGEVVKLEASTNPSRTVDVN